MPKKFLKEATSVKEITFIIVTHNSSGTLNESIESCLATLNNGCRREGRMVVIDNASSDNCPSIIDGYANRYSDIFFGVKIGSNLGFGQANNQIVRYFPSRYYVLVNPDVVFQPWTIARLIHTIDSAPDVAIVCPKLLYPDQSVQPSVRHFPTLTYFVLRNLLGERMQRKLYPFKYYCEELYDAEQPQQIDWGIGAFMMISGDYVSKYGLFDERYFLYFEDVQLCHDAWKNGFRVLFDPQATAVHKYQRASTRNSFNYLRVLHTSSALKFFARHPELWH
ncbi:glycosyltransferase family 2 protein [Gloeobacter morelensis MG652769]|uniref:Glycosyltransferase family 2 protein n=1 Tax=Gloeobacter morelensis MG652769 TaxID=2781736 RepID=A0ABY3PTT1_9CYAN|nr:glycosyltransferase family 2 protein [Gloeobacter morelensis MG652769]